MRPMMTSLHQRKRSRGAAILLALVIMVTVAGLASAAVSRHWSQQRTDALLRANLQHKALANAVLQWAHAILLEDRRQGVTDDLTEIWALPLPPTSVSEFLGTADTTSSGHDALVSGKIEDLDGKWNIWDLFLEEDDKGAHAMNLAVLDRIGIGVGLPPGRLSATIQQARTLVAGQGFYPLNPESCWQWLGLTQEERHLIQPYLTCLPARAVLNLNTASPQLLSWILTPDLSSRIVAERQRKPFDDTTDIGTRVNVGSGQSLFTWMPYISWTFRSSWFAVHVNITMGGVDWPMVQTLQRLETHIIPLAGGVQ